MELTTKFTTARRVYAQRGLSGIVNVVNERLRAVRHHLHRWWWAEHPSLGRLVELRGNVVNVDGLTFSVDHSSISRGVKGLFVLNRYERAERAMLRKYVDPARPVIELGASLGVVSCLTNRLLHDPTRHVVVEANPELIPLLRENRDRNKCKFDVLLGAVGYDTDVINFMVSDSILASSATTMDRRFKVARTVKVPAVALREIVERHNFHDCTLICDIECGEVELIRREIDVIHRRVKTIIMEIHLTTLDAETVVDVISLLTAAGFAQVERCRKTFVFERTR